MLRALGSGLAGACALTAIHETARRQLPDAPRMDILGMRAIAKSMRALGHEPPPEELLHPISLGGDLLSNSLYYSLIGLGGSRNAWLCGALLGLAAGVGAVALPKRLGLSDEPATRTNTTKALTVSWYLLGGLAAAAAYHLMSNDDR